MSDSPLQEVRATLRDAYNFLEARDHMNAAIHCQPVRWSPLTVRVFMAMDTLADLIIAADPTYSDSDGEDQ